MGILVASLTALVAILVTFTDISVKGFTLERIGGTAAVMALSTYVIYFSAEEAGERLCEEGDEYALARLKYDEARLLITGDMIERLRLYLREYAKRELDARRESILISVGISPKEMEKVNKGLQIEGVTNTRVAKRAIKRAAALRLVSLTPSSLLSRGAPRGSSELSSPERFKLIGMAIRLIPAVFSILLTASVILTAKDGLGTAEIIEGILKLSTLPIAAVRGYSAGYLFVRERTIPWLETKTRIIRAFLAECESEKASLACA
jgi:hypothetical protein